MDNTQAPHSFWNSWQAQKEKLATRKPTCQFTVTVSKLDSVVHAGNADLILKQLKTYGDDFSMYVLRQEVEYGRVQLETNADDIWAKEIRNGEKILFEFFGPAPDKEFLSELSKRVNKYTQMDKMMI